VLRDKEKDQSNSNMQRETHNLSALTQQINEGPGCFLPDKMIARVLSMSRRLLSPEKAKHGFGSCQRAGFKTRVVKCKTVAAIWFGRQQPGILSGKKHPDPQINFRRL
jgi:hypothetical protein